MKHEQIVYESLFDSDDKFIKYTLEGTDLLVTRPLFNHAKSYYLALVHDYRETLVSQIPVDLLCERADKIFADQLVESINDFIRTEAFPTGTYRRNEILAHAMSAVPRCGGSVHVFTLLAAKERGLLEMIK